MNNISLNLVENEKKIYDLWKLHNVLDNIKKLRSNGPIWNFLDGPPFVNGTPHHGHLLVSTIKDSLARYHSNNGKQVSYQLGFDCHGLPMEQAAEKEMGIKINSDADIKQISEFNNICQSIQDRCSNTFENVLSKLGRQFESEKTYYTSNINYMNALWISFKQLFDKGLIYRGKKVMPYSYGCMSALSNFEATQNYMNVSHTSLFVKFKLAEKDNIFFLVWTTTPWSIVANMALCLNPELEYVLVESKKEYLWINKDLYLTIFKNNEQIIKTMLGKDLVNIEYIPIFNYFNQTTFKTLNDTYVTNQSGTGIVHMAPLFGADDFRVCTHNNIINNKASDLPDFLNDMICIKNDMFLEGENIKGLNIMECTDKVINYLKNTKYYFKKETIVHSYPFCWRTDTPLIYIAQDCWFLNVQMIKDDMILNNSQIQWFPETIGINRFNNWIANAPDWCLSRNRFWGTPIPIWKCENEDSDEPYICIESKEELEKIINNDINNMHREYIDDIIIYKNGYKYHRIDAVFDCWYESGMAGIAKEGTNCRNAKYPVDFIAESLDQTRGWFYTLNVLSTALFNKPAFKKVIVSGLILASDGMKMSKRLNNYTSPEKIMEEYGSDMLRLYLLSSPATQAQEFKFVDTDILNITKKILPYFHSHRMLIDCITNLRLTDTNMLCEIIESNNIKSNDKLDMWLVSLTNKLKKDIDNNIESLELYKIPDYIIKYIDQLANVWLKFSRDRIKNNISKKDTINSIITLYDVLIKANKLLSPFIPFNTDMLHNVLVNNMFNINEYNSIHCMLSDDIEPYDDNIIESVENVSKIIELARSARTNINKPLSIPIRNMEIYLPKAYSNKIDRYFDTYISEQVNVENIYYIYTDSNCTAIPNKGNIGKMFKKEGGNVIKLINDSIINNKFEDLIDGKITYNYNDCNVIIDNTYFKINVNIIKKNNYHTTQSDIYMILLDETFDEDLLWKTKLGLWKRDIMNTRKQLEYSFWHKLKLVVDSKSIDINIFNKLKNKFEKMINSEIIVDTIQNENVYEFIYNNEIIRYSLIN